MKLAFLFAGQGAQKPGMGKDIYDAYPIAKAMYDQSNIPFDLKEVCFTDSQGLLQDTTYVQPCLLTTSVAIASVLREEGIVPDYVCGLSLGEYSALTFAGSITIKDAQQIVWQRGQLMAQALPQNTTGMAAVLNLDAQIIKDICENVDGVVEIANYNCPGQIVISGEKAALEAASQRCIEAGARRVLPLSVSGAFHSSLLKNASQALRTVLQQYDMQAPKIPVAYNVSGKEETLKTGKPQEKEGIIDLLCRQIHSSVYFEQSIRYLLDQGVTHFIEIGPGNTLAGFVRKIDRSAFIASIESTQHINNFLQQWSQTNGKEEIVQ